MYRGLSVIAMAPAYNEEQKIFLVFDLDSHQETYGRTALGLEAEGIL